MSPTIEVSCRVDYCRVASKEFCEWTGRLDRLSATGCTILSRTRRSHGAAHLSTRESLAMTIQEAEVVWTHWREFTVEFVHLSMQGQDQLQRCLIEASVLAAT